MIFLFIFIFLSIAYCFYMSFFEWKLFDLGKDKTFVGLDNYIRIFQDGIFGQAVGNTLIIVFVCLTLETVLGFLIALTLWNLKRTLRVLQTILLLPMITAPVAVAVVAAVLLVLPEQLLLLQQVLLLLRNRLFPHRNQLQ